MRALLVGLCLLSGCRRLLGFDDVRPLGPAIDSPAIDAPVAPRVRQLEIPTVAAGPHSDFPVLVAITDSWLKSHANGGDVANDLGFDITFSQDAGGGVALAHEVERYDPVAGTLIAWVKVPLLVSGTAFFLRYGDPAITQSLEDAPAVWSASYAGVWHLTAVTDSTGQSTIGNDDTTAVEGKIAGARDVEAGNVGIPAGAGINNVFVGGGTVEAWFRADTAGQANFGRVVDKGFSFSMGDGNVAGTFQLGHSFSGGPGNWGTPMGSISLNVLIHVAATYDSSSAANLPTLYVNGTSVAVQAITSPIGTAASDTAVPLVLGDRASSGRRFDGLIDEVRLSTTVRPAGWIATSFANQNDPAGFLVVGPAR